MVQDSHLRTAQRRDFRVQAGYLKVLGQPSLKSTLTRSTIRYETSVPEQVISRSLN